MVVVARAGGAAETFSVAVEKGQGEGTKSRIGEGGGGGLDRCVVGLLLRSQFGGAAEDLGGFALVEGPGGPGLAVDGASVSAESELARDFEELSCAQLAAGREHGGVVPDPQQEGLLGVGEGQLVKGIAGLGGLGEKTVELGVKAVGLEDRARLLFQFPD